jgi:hypothetical protein
MRSMRKSRFLASTFFGLALGFYACGTGTIVDTNSSDGGSDASTVPAVKRYSFVSIVDLERKADANFSCSETNGPGSDIDAVALLRDGKVVGYGLTGSAAFARGGAPDECANSACSGGNCKYASISSTFSEADLVARTLGPPDAVVNKSSDDKGYLSLNGGTLQLQIGDNSGKGSAQTFKSGDQIKVFEVDQAQKTDANGCVCKPEHYQVIIQDKDGSSLALKPVQFIPENSDVCGTAPGPTDLYGCGTTAFAVP